MRFGSLTFFPMTTSMCLVMARSREESALNMAFS
jgi:hypothetical protein